LVHTADDRPKAVPLEMAMASSMEPKVMIGDTGPKVSSRTTVISGRTRSITVGAYRARRRGVAGQQAGALRRWPRPRAARTAAPPPSSITVPISVFGSDGVAEGPGRVLSTTSLGEALRHLLVHQHALDGGAALAGVLVRALAARSLGLVEVGVVHHDDRVVAAELEHHAAVAGLGRDVLADRTRRR
jgi:hypothetical protein